MWIACHNANRLCIIAHIKLINATKNCTAFAVITCTENCICMDDMLKYYSDWLHTEIKGE